MALVEVCALRLEFLDIDTPNSIISGLAANVTNVAIGSSNLGRINAFSAVTLCVGHHQ